MTLTLGICRTTPQLVHYMNHGTISDAEVLKLSAALRTRSRVWIIASRNFFAAKYEATLHTDDRALFVCTSVPFFCLFGARCRCPNAPSQRKKRGCKLHWLTCCCCASVLG